MDQTATQQHTQTPVQQPADTVPPPSNSFQQPPQKRTNPFSILSKVFLFLLLAVGLLLGGFYLGTTSQESSTSLTSQPVQSPSPSVMTTPSDILQSPTPASTNTHTVTAGLEGDATVFEPYSLDVPEGWTDARETTVAAGIDKLTLTKNGYSVTIYQAPMGGGSCMYAGDEPNEFAQLYESYADINGKSAQYRRSWTESTGKAITYTVCQKIQDNAYSVMSTFGAITVVSPNPANASMLAEIDGMIASLIKQ